MIYVDTTNRKLHLICRYARSSDVMEKVYDVALGDASNPTPRGTFHVVRKIICPAAYYSDLKPGDVDWLGVASMELNIAYGTRPYAIHGCHPDIPIAEQHTSGCVGMLAADLVEIFNWVHQGQPVVMWHKTYKKAYLPNISNYNRLRNWPEEKARPA